MAGREIDFKSATITGVDATGYVTIASVAGWFKHAIVWLSNTGQPTKRAIVTEVIVASNKLGVSFRTSDAGSVPSYGRSDPTLYNGGTIVQEQQFVYDFSDGSI